VLEGDERSRRGATAVRRAGAQDWAALRAIRLEALADEPDAYVSTHLESVTYPDGRWRRIVVDYCYFLAEDGGRVVGMASGGANELYPGTRWLYGMFVTPAARGTGVATQLVDAVVEWARGEGATELYLQVTASLPRSRAFYVKSGFVETGDRLTMHRDARLELLTMRRSLAGA
jgi:GNAT superfamily N-acetyltransferase